ncbi:hypothetical protein Tsubulata_042748 [Turnera subulata]|uniref:Transmembrane protein n=1 Tax=Turnera subulata TaxID=218843 RepID=A0A9Q0FXU7_9ROSI|nr:hypothetical protein Tsubulata_042748 [Turnera subulata]
MESSNNNNNQNQASSTAQAAIRCVKAGLLLSSLKKPLPCKCNHHLDDEQEEEEDKEMWMREVSELKVILARERLKNARIKRCGMMESLLLLLVTAVFSFWISFSSLH